MSHTSAANAMERDASRPRDHWETEIMASPERIREIIDFVSTDAYSDDEVMAGWAVAMDGAVTLPLHARALGQPVSVLAFDSDSRHGIRCEIQGEGISHVRT